MDTYSYTELQILLMRASIMDDFQLRILLRSAATDGSQMRN